MTKSKPKKRTHSERMELLDYLNARASRSNAGFPTYLIAGSLAQTEGYQELADEHYTKAIELESNSYVAHFNRGYVNSVFGRRQYEKAVRDFTRAIEIQPPKPTCKEATPKRGWVS